MHLDPTLCREAMLARDPRFDGRFFTAVTSTGIYCRPICPARPPAAANCLFFPSAAAAQDAGFRPCLRCRPETAPGLGAWRGTSSTVSRALTLIDDGALNEGSTNDLAARLGIGDRQLRRLFDRHVGAAPIAVAQTRRVLLAKQLIHETDLPMTAVAHASGFGSVRRFNETFLSLFGRAPGTLRRAPSAWHRDTGVTLSLGYRPPYDWGAMLNFLSARAIPGVEAVTNGTYARVIELSGDVGTLSVSNEPGRCRLIATIRYPRLDQLSVIVARLRRMFDLEADPAVIGAALSRDKTLSDLVALRPGLRVPGAWDAFELGVRAIVGQQVSVTAATQLAGRIVRDHGTTLRSDEGAALTHAFPRPSALAVAQISRMPASRAKSIAALAAAVSDNPGLFERAANLEAGLAALCRLPGIGDWTANYIAMRAMREPDAFPAADIGLMRAMDVGQGRPSAQELITRAEAWRPWRAYAALHLWTAETNPSAKPARETGHALAA